jgi:hypothetical protein
LQRALFHHGDGVELCHQPGAVADHNDRRAARLQSVQRGLQRGLAFGVEVGIGLVEHHRARLPIWRARQRDALALTARKCDTGVAEHGVVALRQPQDHVVRLRSCAARITCSSSTSPSRAMFWATVASKNDDSCGR